MKPHPYFPEKITLLFFTGMLMMQWVLFKMHPIIAGDTASYLTNHDWPACLGDPRIPLYGFLVRKLPSLNWVPWLQFFAYMLSALYFITALKNIKIQSTLRTASGIALACSMVLLLSTCTVIPTLPSVACLLFATGCVISFYANPKKYKLMGYLLFATAAWLFNPSFLPFIFVFPLLLWGLSRTKFYSLKKSVLLLFCVLSLLPFLLFCSFRFEKTHDFNVVSYGGFQMSGMAGLMLTPEIIHRLPIEDQTLATTIYQLRTQQEKSGTAIATPLNSSNQRSFISESLGYFDILARTYDNVLYGSIGKERDNASWIDFNKRLQKLSIDTVRAKPTYYAAWVAGALSRWIGRAIVFNPSFLLSSIILLGLFLYAPNKKTRRISPAFLMIVIGFTIGAGVLSILVTYPVQRYIDCADIFLAVFPIYFCIERM